MIGDAELEDVAEDDDIDDGNPDEQLILLKHSFEIAGVRESSEEKLNLLSMEFIGLFQDAFWEIIKLFISSFSYFKLFRFSIKSFSLWRSGLV